MHPFNVLSSVATCIYYRCTLYLIARLDNAAFVLKVFKAINIWTETSVCPKPR